ncbi:MAG: hypothetical protein K2Q25_12365 [Mycobacteriaceae bacterium]|nr:hypothetical protein [Mycobacteriaceae bacterium]
MKQEAPQQRHSRTAIPAIHGGEHVTVSPAATARMLVVWFARNRVFLSL